MHHLINRNEGYPFEFFTEKAFHKEQVVNYISNAYAELAEMCEVINTQDISRRDIYTFMLGKVGRIVKLNEDHHDLFFSEEHNEYIRALAVRYDGDLAKVTEEYLEADGNLMSVSNDMSKLFEKDIKTVFDQEHMFYLDSMIPYNSLWYVADRESMSPFSDDQIKKIFRNIPLTRVW